MPRAVYSAVFLDPHSHQALLRHFPVPDGHKVLAHHCTLEFRPSDASLDHLPIGALVSMQVVAHAQDEKGQAVAVRMHLLGGGPLDSKNDIPHVTISVAPGTSPVYSNELLKNGSKPAPTVFLSGTVGFFDGRDEVTTPDM